MTTPKRFFTGASLLLILLVFSNCSKDDNDSDVTLTGKAQFEITDGPADDANVQGAFITVAAVKVDGQTISNFSGKQTIDLMAYQNGNTKALGLAELETGTYSNVTLVLDYETDANGNSPGCYVLTTDNVKHDLQAAANASNEIALTSTAFEVKENSTTNIVVDFDLRKAIRYEDTPQNDDQYDFVNETEMRVSLRLFAKSETGKVSGKCEDNLGLAGEKIVVYAYKKGTYNKNTEMTAQGESQIQFKNAVTSATVDAQGNFTLAFLEEGDYELHFVGYENSNNTGKREVKGELELNLLTNLGIDLNNISIGADANVSLTVSVIGILP
jgi:hypothetical protein